MAMTEEERRAARNAASRKWYLAHRQAKAALNKAGAAKPGCRKVELKPAKAQTKTDTSKLEKELDRFVEKSVKTADAYKALVKEAAAKLAEAYKTGDGKLIAKTNRDFGRRLSLEVIPSHEEGRAELKPSVGAKVFRIPKAKTEPPADPAPDRAQAPDPDPEGETDELREKIVPVDPSLLTGIEDGSVTAGDVDTQGRDDETEADDEDDEEIDPEDMDDDQYKEYLERQAEREAEAWVSGHGDMMREMEEQGAFDGFEN